MSRQKRKAASAPVTPRYTIEEARTELYGLVRKFAAIDEASESLLDRAVEIGPRRRGGAILVPEVDALEAARRIEELEDELEDIGLALVLQERLAETGARSSLDEVAAGLELTDVLTAERVRLTGN
jgi:hypothetical protein